VATESTGILSAGFGFKPHVIPWLLWDVLSVVVMLFAIQVI